LRLELDSRDNGNNTKLINIMKHLIHPSLFESQNSEPVCDYYDDKKPDS